MQDIRQSMRDLVCAPYDMEITVSTTKFLWVIAGVAAIGLTAIAVFA